MQLEQPFCLLAPTVCCPHSPQLQRNGAAQQGSGTVEYHARSVLSATSPFRQAWAVLSICSRNVRLLHALDLDLLGPGITTESALRYGRACDSSSVHPCLS